MLLSVCGAKAQTMDYLTFRTTEGVERSVASVGTVITFSNGNIQVENGDDKFSYTIQELSAMYFATEPTGIQPILTEQSGLNNVPAGTVVRVYNIAGQPVATFRKAEGQQGLPAALPKGIYILKANGMTYKSLVR